MNGIHINEGEWIALIGNAGAGKTTLSRSIMGDHATYSSDFNFIGDSYFRKVLLQTKQKAGLDSYMDALNQISWWDWDAIYDNLTFMREAPRGAYRAIAVYDRDAGAFRERHVLRAETLVYEGVMLPSMLLDMFDRVYYLYVPESIRLQRLLKKDTRRSTIENIARFLICDYSEKLFYTTLFDRLDRTGKLIYIDGLTLEPMQRPTFDPVTCIPLEV